MSELGPLMVDIAGTELSVEDRELLCHPHVGSVILFARNYRSPKQLAELCADIRAVREPRLLIAVDYEGGRVQRFRDGFTRVPPMANLGRRYESDRDGALAAARACGQVIGEELGAVGIDLPLAPVLDLDRGESRVIGDRAFHSDPRVVAALARAFRAGLRDTGMAATGKHFPGHGGVYADSHTEIPEDGREPNALSGDIEPFECLIRDGLESIMMAHVVYPAVSSRPASLAAEWIRDRLRGVLGFEGVVLCDDLGMAGAGAVGDYPARVEAALAAGCDILPVCNNREAVLGLLDDPRLSDPPTASASIRGLYAQRDGDGLSDDELAHKRALVRALADE